MNNKLSPPIYELLGKVIKDDISRFTITVHSPNKKGEGFLGEICFVSLEDKTTERIFHFVVKQAFTGEAPRMSESIRDVFLNEIFFYTKIWPRFQQFQDPLLGVRGFDKMPKCLATDSDVKSEKLLLENLRYQGFDTFNKRGTFDKEHMEYVFRQYGKFHAISVAFRALYPQEFSEFSKGLKDQLGTWGNVNSFQAEIKHSHALSFESLIAGEDDGVIEKYKPYLEDGVDHFKNSISYKSKYPVILHGDCWSNNMMFKYDDHGKLADLRLIDFQLSKQGSAAADLAYCLYSSGSKEIFSEFSHYLEIYYKSLSESIRALGCDPDQLYPFRVLKEEWKHCSNMGFTMALMVWKVKLTVDSAKYDEGEYKRRSRDIIVHLYEHGLL